jgi:hypothetical protein
MVTDDETPDLSRFPRRVDADGGAELVTDLYFPIAADVVQGWPLVWRFVDGRAVCETADLFSFAQAKMDAAPLLPFPGRHAVGELLQTAERLLILAKLATAPQSHAYPEPATA